MEESKALSVLDMFKFQGQVIPVLMIDGEPWWFAVDVCRVLEIGNVPQAVSRLRDDEKAIITNDSNGSNSQITIISNDSNSLTISKHSKNIVNESGMYNLIFTSRKPEAEAFRYWVTHEVLPAIRRTGSYSLLSTQQQMLVTAATQDIQQFETVLAAHRAGLTRLRRMVVPSLPSGPREPSRSLPDEIRYQIPRFIERKGDGPSATDLQNYMKRYTRKEIEQTLSEMVKTGELQVKRSAHTVRYIFSEDYQQQLEA